LTDAARFSCACRFHFESERIQPYHTPADVSGPRSAWSLLAISCARRCCTT
jgi:hypothetical protein